MRLSEDTYLRSQIQSGLIRFLHSIDLRPGSATLGIADREYWAWKTKDFANGTNQAGLLPLVLGAELLDLPKERIKDIVKKCLLGTQRIQRSNGSFEEAYPLESSFAVTGLVVTNLLAAYIHAPSYFDEFDVGVLKSISRKGVQFIERTPETHGVISNHLMSSFLAMDLYRKVFLGEASFASLSILAASIKSEGWYEEYGGPDPGYQSLLNHYYLLAVSCGFSDVHNLSKSVKFVSQFLFDNFTFAGEFGSRGTSVFYPSGLVDAKADSFPMNWFSEYIKNPFNVTPTNIDTGNHVPLLSSWALLYFFEKQRPLAEPVVIASDREWDNGHLFFRKTPSYCLVFSKKTGVFKLVYHDGVSVKEISQTAFLVKKSLCRGILKSAKIERDKITLVIDLQPSVQKLNDMLSTIVLRVLSLSLYWTPMLQRLLKKALAWFVMKGVSNQTGSLLVQIDLNNLGNPVVFEHAQEISIINKGFAGHMASANYFSK